MVKAIYPGTFDPITIGHLDIIKRASSIFEELIIAVADNPDKKPLFDASERVSMVEQSLSEAKISRNNIKIKHFSGLLVDYAKDNKCKILVRGLRAVSDFEYEFQMSCMNSKLEPEIQTVFLAASDNVQFISSRFVKQIAKLGGNISGFVTKSVAKKL